ncbi:MAG TPA: DUF350 domain-containing protein [Gemmatimonadaceae bacterium]|nr:DUF350 domain-containing protein [Gemmatimonadaceae bacterium]
MDYVAELVGLTFLTVSFFWMWVAKLLFDRGERDADHAIEERSHLPSALRRAGIYIAIPTALYGLLRSPEAGYRADVVGAALNGGVLTALLLLGGRVGERVLLPRRPRADAGRPRSLAEAIVEAAAFIATGIIAQGAFSGTGGSLLSAIAFFVLGEAALLGVVRLYEGLSRIPVRTEVRAGNSAAALLVGGMLVSYSLVLSSAVAGDFTGWLPDLQHFAWGALKGTVIVVAALWPIDGLFLPNTDLKTEVVRDRNVAAVAVATGVQFALALLVAGIFL